MNDEISVKELSEKLLSGADFILIDVREAGEIAVGKIAVSVHIAMSEIETKLADLDKSKEYVLQCRSGARSRNVLEYMRQNGFANLKNLTGGIMAWSSEIDSSINV